MARLAAWLLIVLGCIAPLSAQPQFGGGEPNIAARLVSETPTPASGSTVTIAIEMVPKPGWHGYWSNPGEAGFEPRFDWTLPPGARVGTVAYPVPQLLEIAGLANYVFERDHALLVPLELPAGLASGTRLPVRLVLDYLACTDEVCVPQQADLTLDLTVGNGTIDAATRARFDGWRAQLPVTLAARAVFERDGDGLRLAVPFPAGTALDDVRFFPARYGSIVDNAPQRVTRSGDSIVLALAAPAVARGDTLDGVLAIGEGRGLTISAVPGSVPAGGGLAWAFALAVAGALLGGLILNVMPCVFPILSLKALTLAKAGGDERAARGDALGYAAGAIGVCVALGGLILALRAGGSAVGWAFQLQSPAVTVGLLVLVTAIALNLAGLFELPSVGGKLATGNSVATGALAAFVATPCTGPFMGAALGAALVLPPVAALGVFAGLGLGLALPFLLLGFVPALRRRLPQPGPWMATLRRMLSVPMFATALGLAWLLGRQAGSDASMIGLAAALVGGLALWWSGLRQRQGKPGLVPAVAVVLLAAGLSIVALPAGADTGEAVTGQPSATSFSETRLAELRSRGQPVFLYFTADWCLTCKVNERVAIDRSEVQTAFRTARVTTLVGDWTRADPAIGRFLAAHGRSGVPLYLFYAAGAAEPVVLPQVLTPATLTALVQTS